MRKENLLIEIGTEELPPKALKGLAEAFQAGLSAALAKDEFEFASVHYFAAPRRLALHVKALSETQPDKVIEKRGPAVSAAFDSDGNPTRAAQGWANANGITVEQAQRLKTDKGEWLLHNAQQTGESIQAKLQSLVEKALNALPIQKPMRWGNSEAQFIRPVHTVLAMYGNELIDIEVLGKRSSTTIQGHRFHGSGSVNITHADSYVQQLEGEYVLADFEARRTRIAEQLDAQASTLGLKANYSESLLDEIASLVEWPVIMQASFDKGFLAVPKEALIYTMKDDQKYVPLLDAKEQLASTFLFVANIDSTQPEQVIEGNERVIRPRLADAEFFFNTDKKTTLASRIESLSTVLFQKQLGTLADKSQRIAAVAGHIAAQLNADSELARRAGLLSKADLMTNMVMEFPDVQGVMGMHYARHDGEHELVANALFEQYLPRFAGDSIATNAISISVALADKLDTLVGIFGIGQLPKGDKDPFALRRAAIGVLRTIVDNNLRLDLIDLISFAREQLDGKLTNDNVTEQVLDFVLGRFNAIYQDQQIDVDVVQAVAAKQPTKPADFNDRIHAVAGFKQHPAAESLAAAHKRTANILNKNVQDGVPLTLSQSRLIEPAEIALYKALESTKSAIRQPLEAGHYADVLAEVASLKEPVDTFFDSVMVMADDEEIRNNRIALLGELRSVFECTADISRLSI
ncbi:glycine--tRNA ligase subunit beta [Alteromonas oceanisediminis]|uniref:glycine--tRNA ligase subunit beta n=1 Tax=Alteromonas oceanisediminis TaxID=2836180 RepID=UPI001BD96436|nr:glycine--tRNA ligase subunit beta [Alteromonas oceanisediminis]MBT0586668.1 glycine--tRNA ligase subunit beta [Alteromonas oceanisediminis]